MSMTVRNIKFWARLCLGCLGFSIGVSFIWFLFMGMGSDKLLGTNGISDWRAVLSTYPYYLLISGMLFVVVMGISYIQVYLPVLLSMNATRKSIARGIFGCIFAIVAGILLICAVFWRLVPGDLADSGWKLMPLFTGVYFIMAAVVLLLGVATVRWGKVGGIMAAIMCTLVGAGAGMSFALSGKGLVELVVSVADGNFRYLAIAGVILYLAVGVFASKALRKLEARF